MNLNPIEKNPQLTFYHSSKKRNIEKTGVCINPIDEVTFKGI